MSLQRYYIMLAENKCKSKYSTKQQGAEAG